MFCFWFSYQIILFLFLIFLRNDKFIFYHLIFFIAAKKWVVKIKTNKFWQQKENGRAVSVVNNNRHSNTKCLTLSAARTHCLFAEKICWLLPTHNQHIYKTTYHKLQPARVHRILISSSHHLSYSKYLKHFLSLPPNQKKSIAVAISSSSHHS